jgi:hypothetical protein
LILVSPVVLGAVAVLCVYLAVSALEAHIRASRAERRLDALARDVRRWRAQGGQRPKGAYSGCRGGGARRES